MNQGVERSRSQSDDDNSGQKEYKYIPRQSRGRSQHMGLFYEMVEELGVSLHSLKHYSIATGRARGWGRGGPWPHLTGVPPEVATSSSYSSRHLGPSTGILQYLGESRQKHLAVFPCFLPIPPTASCST